ncbi:MAG: hypothetical protein JRI86_04770 [Deltaproteobacteria bacterium]|nr:hypothetical protein [Deltaproteobacteria bacterium]
MKGSFKKVIPLFVTGVFLTGIITVNVVADVAEDAKAAYWNMVKEQEQAEQLLEQAKAGEDPTEIDLAGKKVEATTMAASILKAIAGGVAQADVIYIVAVYERVSKAIDAAAAYNALARVAKALIAAAENSDDRLAAEAAAGQALDSFQKILRAVNSVNLMAEFEWASVAKGNAINNLIVALINAELDGIEDLVSVVFESMAEAYEPPTVDDGRAASPI